MCVLVRRHLHHIAAASIELEGHYVESEEAMCAPVTSGKLVYRCGT